jgi:K+-sensing histidine kinase KdpD
MVFETTITDDGKGIKSDRIPNLFKIFGELEHNIELQESKNVEDNGIGVGLCCSKIIANAI